MACPVASGTLLRAGRRSSFAQLLPAGHHRSRSSLASSSPPPSTATRRRACSSCRIRPDRRLYSTAKRPDPPPPSEDTAPPAAELPSAAESRRSPLARTLSGAMDGLQTRLLAASATLNDLTGYTAIEAIKTANAQLEGALAEAQARLRGARAAYKSTHARRAATQREVTALLARKDGWAPADLERFTALYRRDHDLEAGVAAAAEALTAAEADDARLAAALNAGILRRYHEEQVWSDRIRRQSTWGTWALMGVNVLLFLGLQFVAEPWRRARLVRGVVEAEGEAFEGMRRELEGLKAALAAGQERKSAAGGGDAAASGVVVRSAAAVEDEKRQSPWKGVLSDPRTLGTAISDLVSDRRLDLRMRDASLIALDGAVAGAVLAAGIATILLRRA